MYPVTSLLVALLITVAPSVTQPTAAPATRAVWPLDPRPTVVAGFDPPDSLWGSGHRGVDLLGHIGEPVHATLAGTVTFAEDLAGRGVVVVDHGRTRTTYEPVDASVHVGQRVSAGTVLGTLKLSMSHCFPRACLHWGLIEGKTYLDPLTLVGGGPVRLLPLTGRAVPARLIGATVRLAGPVARLLAGPQLGLGWGLTPAGAPVGTPPAVAPW